MALKMPAPLNKKTRFRAEIIGKIAGLGTGQQN
jgi:hypothetical protein